ncbi:hypothetical protein LINGRAHAP2_LOCUS24410 [Linum grandiflorum]
MGSPTEEDSTASAVVVQTPTFSSISMNSSSFGLTTHNFLTELSNSSRKSSSTNLLRSQHRS